MGISNLQPLAGKLAVKAYFTDEETEAGSSPPSLDHTITQRET